MAGGDGVTTTGGGERDMMVRWDYGIMNDRTGIDVQLLLRPHRD
jgi:hypothetical protein